MAARARQHLHQLHSRAEKPRQLLCTLLDIQAGTKLRPLGRNARRAIVGVANTRAHTADGLDCSICQRQTIRTERQRFYEIRGCAQAAGRDKRDVAATVRVKVTPGSRQCRDSGHGDIVPEQQRRRPGAATSSIEYQVVGPRIQRKLNVCLDVIGR